MKLPIHSSTPIVPLKFGEWISNFITHFTGHVIIYPCISGYSAVLNAAVVAEVGTPGGSILNLTLLDNGAGMLINAG